MARILKYGIDEEFFRKIDTEEKAYYLGFMFADGTISPERNTIKLSLKEEDKEILEKLKICIKSERPLFHIKRNPSWKGSFKGSKDSWCLDITNKFICQDIQNLGCTKIKTRTAKFPEIEDKLLSHFIRGYFDGDGTITSSSPISNKQGRKSDVKWNIIGTEQFTRSVQNIMVENLDFSKTKLQKVKNVFYLEYKGGKQIDKIRKWLYNNSTIFLERKHNKFINYASDVAIPE